MLGSWKWVEDDEGVKTVTAYALKEVVIAPERLTEMATCLRDVKVSGVIAARVVEFWFDLAWVEPNEPDLVLDVFDIDVRFQIRWAEEGLITEIMPIVVCGKGTPNI
jgi:hypothetical protein